MQKLPFTHLRVELDGLTVAGQVWRKGDLVPLDDSTPDPVARHVLEQVAAMEHEHLTAGSVREVMDDESGDASLEFERIKRAVKLPPESETEVAIGDRE